jgi:hypothetical protein
MEIDRITREQLLGLLRGGHAHMSYNAAVADFPMERINSRPPNVSYTPWHLLEHLRISQWDILEFIIDPEYVSPEWPKGYWPAQDAQADRLTWEKTIHDFQKDLKALERLVEDPDTDLYQPIPHGDGQNILREILTVSDHNAYHIGEFAILRQVMGTWPPERKAG